jgi:hypothetical protein
MSCVIKLQTKPKKRWNYTNSYQNTIRSKTERRGYRVQKDYTNMVKGLIDFVILAIKINESMLSVH